MRAVKIMDCKVVFFVVVSFFVLGHFYHPPSKILQVSGFVSVCMCTVCVWACSDLALISDAFVRSERIPITFERSDL